MIAGCWLLWLAANWSEPENLLPRRRSVVIPLLAVLLVLLWAVVQTLPIVPESWAHPIWSMASGALGYPLPATISLNPWRTEAEILKLTGSVAACWLAYSMAQRAETARLLFNAVIATGAFYALYGFVLILADVTQAQLIYGVPFSRPFVTGPFMLHNSFATYAGLATLAAVTRLFASGSETVVAKRGGRQLAVTVIQFVFGRGAILIVAAIVLFAAVIASASRGGFAATSCGLAAMAIVSLFHVRGRPARLWLTLGVLATAAPLFFLVLGGGNKLSDRVVELVDAGDADAGRLALWAATRHMIADAPWTGLGLGSFQDAYPLYATQVFAFVMDKAHCDYLEFAAGIGLPAAIAWWMALTWLAILCLRGALARRRNQLFALTAFGATVLVAVHSSADFSLQIPAVALVYAALLGVGLAQSERTAVKAA